MSETHPANILAPDAASGKRFGVLASRFNEHITDVLLEGAVRTLHEHGADAVHVHRVPGAYELPFAAGALARTGGLDAIVCLGALIRGETSHFDVLAHSTAIALQEVGREHGLPVAFGVITCENEEQALARAGGTHGNKGEEAALAAIEMTQVFAAIEA